MIILLIILLAAVLYFYSFNNRDKNFDYKLTSEYQKSGNDDKLRTDILKELEIVIKKEVITSFSDTTLRIKAIEDLIKTRETSYYLNIESIAQQYKISHGATFEAILSSFNHARYRFNIPVQTVPAKKHKELKSFSLNSKNLTKEQKLSCNIFLSGIASTSYMTNPVLWKAYSKIEKKHLESLGISIQQTTDYLASVQQNFPRQKEILQSFDNSQKDLLVSMAVELLWCNGQPSQTEYLKFEKAFEKVAGIDKEEFAERVLKLSSVKIIS